MSQPLIATGRMRWTYTYSGIQHHIYAYVRNIQVSGSTWNINSRATDSNDVAWRDAAEGWEQTLSYLLANTSAGGDVILEKLDSGVWLPLDTYSPVTSNSSGTTQPTTQCTLVLRDKTFKQVKVALLEVNQAAPQHWNVSNGGDTAMDNFVKQYTSGSTVTHPPFEWQVGRSDQFLHPSSFIGITVTLNKKMRRARGYT